MEKVLRFLSAVAPESLEIVPVWLNGQPAMQFVIDGASDGVGSALTGTVTVEVPGTPVRMTGTLRRQTDGRGGTVETVDGDLRAKVPLIGGRIEKAVEPVLTAAIRAEERVGQAWLAASA